MLQLGVALNLPTALSISIFGEWLDVRDLSHVDVALLARPKLREKFLELVSSECFSSPGLETKRANELSYMAWVVGRKIAMKKWTIANPHTTYLRNLHAELFKEIKVQAMEALVVNGKDEIFPLVKRICSEAKRLHTLKLSNLVWLTYPRLRHFLQDCWTTLRNLHLDTLKHLSNAHFVRLVPYLTHLRSLMLGRFDLSTVLLGTIIKYCRQLNQIQFTSCAVHNESLLTLIASYTRTERKGIATSNKWSATSTTTTSTTTSNTKPTTINQLQSIHLTYNTGVILNTIATTIANHCTSLMELSLVGDYDDVSALSSDALIYAAARLPQLQRLDVSKNNYLTDSAIVAVVTHCKQVRMLCVRSCRRLTDAAIAAVAQHCAHLQELDISWCDSITDTSLQHLNRGNRDLLGNLRVLKINNCHRISNTEGLLELVRRCALLTLDNVSI